MPKQLISKAIGIDLGTTNSVVAILDPTDTQIVVHRDLASKRETTPSCVWKDTKSGEMVVGRRAFARIGTTPSPVRSIKRKMGRQEKISLTNEQLTPEDISTHILKEMKRQIEEDVAKFETEDADWIVNRALITIPAYFDLPQIEATRKAGEAAGLRVLELLHEPTAAACYHCWRTHTQNGIFMVYDLGGGTFDVSILRCRAGSFEVLGISGNNYLGGDDIDDILARELQRRLQAEAHWNLDLDIQHDEEDWLRFEKMKKLMEGVKKALSHEHEFLLRDDVSLKDKAGEQVDIEILFERSEIDALMYPSIKRTIPYCLDALEKAREKAGVTIADLDAIILAGGSTHIPLVREVVRKMLCADPTAQEPRARCSEPVYEEVDSIVALGAAIRAAAIGGLEIENAERTVRISFHGMGATGAQQIHIGGQVQALDPTVQLSGAYIKLVAPGRKYEDECDVSQNGAFGFTRIPLQLAHENLLRFEVYDRQDKCVTAVDRSITQRKNAPVALGGGNTAVLAKSIYLETVHAGKISRKKLMKAPQTLPAREKFAFSHPGARYVEFSLYQLRRKIKEISVQVPSTVPRGTPIDLSLQIDEYASITCNGTIGDIVFQFRVDDPVDRLVTEADTAALNTRYLALSLKPLPEVEQTWRESVQRIIEAIRLRDVARAAHEYEELEELWESIAPPEPVTLYPPGADFDKLTNYCLPLHNLACKYAPITRKDYDADAMAKKIGSLRDQGERAYAAGDQEGYGDAFAQFTYLFRQLSWQVQEILPPDLVDKLLVPADEDFSEMLRSEGEEVKVIIPRPEER
jgi:molecular chaperone DnaK